MDSPEDSGERQPRTYTRRSEDVELRTLPSYLLRSQAGKRILAWGFGIACSIASAMGGYLKAQQDENGTLQRELNATRWQVYSDDWRERLVKAEAQVRFALEDNAQIRSEVKDLTKVTRENNQLLERILAQMRKKGDGR